MTEYIFILLLQPKKMFWLSTYIQRYIKEGKKQCTVVSQTLVCHKARLALLVICRAMIQCQTGTTNTPSGNSIESLLLSHSKRQRANCHTCDPNERFAYKS